MSIERHKQVKCPKCGHMIDVTVWDSVNVQMNPEMKKEIVDGVFGNVDCPECGLEIHIANDFLYHDMKEHRLVYCTPGDDEQIEKWKKNTGDLIETVGKKYTSKMNGYEYRIVRSLNELREKILIWDMGYDDCVMEVMKSFTLCGIPKEKLHEFNPEEVLFYKEPGKDAMFIMINKKGEQMGCSFINDVYDSIMMTHGDFIASQKTGEPEIIDLEWGFNIMQKIMDKKNVFH